MNGKVISMKQLDVAMQESIQGGAMISVWTGIVIAALAVFLSGLIEGITNPERCNG